MPKNTQGGSKYKKGANSESSTSKKSKKLFNDLLEDLCGSEEDMQGIHFGKVVKKLGEGRMEVIYIFNDRLETVRAPIKGSIRGRGKRDAWVEVGTFVVLNETGLAGCMSHEIVMPLTSQQVTLLRKQNNIDERLFEKTETTMGEEGIEFEDTEEPEEEVKEEEEELDIDRI